MRPLARFSFIVLVIAFTTGTFVQAWAAPASMIDLPMEMSQSAGDPMPGCDDCGDGPGALECFVVCIAPALAILDTPLTFAPLVGMPIEPASARPVLGEARAPDPYPPRPSVLN